MKFIDLFAGVGGFRLGMEANGGQCVFSSEWDRAAQKVYHANFGETPAGDITQIDAKDIPGHDVLCAGFPCQPFSRAGVAAAIGLQKDHGFKHEKQGNLFFEIMRITEAKQPSVLFLENVKNIVTHDKGNTFRVIINSIAELGYFFHYAVIDPSPLIAQRRLRCFMICTKTLFTMPEVTGDPLPLRSVLEDNVDESFTKSDKAWEGIQRRNRINRERNAGFVYREADLDKPSHTLLARYGRDGKECLIPQKGKNPRMLTPREFARLQGFPEDFILPPKKNTSYRLLGNSVPVPVVTLLAKHIGAML